MMGQLSQAFQTLLDNRQKMEEEKFLKVQKRKNDPSGNKSAKEAKKVAQETKHE